MCDAIEDCSEAADEQGCSSKTCPGLLYCREDDICVHPLHICDGVVDCMLSMDDEAFCDVLTSCHHHCRCLGYSMLCTDVNIGKHAMATHYKILIFEDVVFQNYDILSDLHNLFYVEIHNVWMPVILSTFFLNLVHLINLNLANNSITSIKPHSFKNLSSLNSFNLRFNQLYVLQEYTFHGLLALLNLDLSDLHVNQIEKCAFCFMMHLKTLNLSSNKLTNVFGGMFKGMSLLETLEIINIEHNMCSRIHCILSTSYRWSTVS